MLQLNELINTRFTLFLFRFVHKIILLFLIIIQISNYYSFSEHLSDPFFIWF